MRVTMNSARSIGLPLFIVQLLFSLKFGIPKIITIWFVVAIAEVYKNEGNDACNKRNYNSAIHFYTEGIKVNCKDEELNAKLYNNRAVAHFNLGKKSLHLFLEKMFSFVCWKCCWRKGLRDFSSCCVTTFWKKRKSSFHFPLIDVINEKKL